LKNNSIGTYVSLGLMLGTGLGILISSLFDLNLSFSIIFMASAGIIIGTIIAQLKKKK